MLPLPTLPHNGRYRRANVHGRRPWRAAVVVPARDEAARILACLEALRCQWSLDGRSMLGHFPVVLVVNGTSDATCGEVLRWAANYPELPLVLVDVDFPAPKAHVGSARGLGLDIAAALLEHNGWGKRLLFSTDADSRLAPNAVAEAYAFLQRGADAVGAHIVAGEADTSKIGLKVNAYRALHSSLRHRYYPGEFDVQPSHGDFGGAGFGVSLSAYKEVGGLPCIPYHEDQRMRRRLLDANLKIVYPRTVTVYTSTRTDGRAEWGMARQLAAWEDDHAAGKWPVVPCMDGVVWKYALKAALRDGRPPLGYFDRSGRLAEVWAATDPGLGFEARWRKFWTHPTTAEIRETRFPQRPLPEAVESFETGRKEVALRAAPAARLGLRQPGAAGTPKA